MRCWRTCLRDRRSRRSRVRTRSRRRLRCRVRPNLRRLCTRDRLNLCRRTRAPAFGRCLRWRTLGPRRRCPPALKPPTLMEICAKRTRAKPPSSNPSRTKSWLTGSVGALAGVASEPPNRSYSPTAALAVPVAAIAKIMASKPTQKLRRFDICFLPKRIGKPIPVSSHRNTPRWACSRRPGPVWPCFVS